jgi:molybdopterin-binding protein
MPKPRQRPPGEAARILSLSFATIKQWIYKGKLRTLGGHHRILEEHIERHLRKKLADESRKKWSLGPDKISERNQLLGRILRIKVDGLMAQVRILAGYDELTPLITADTVSELGLRTGDEVIALVKSSQIIILREPV